MENLGPFKLTLIVEGENKKRLRIDTHHLIVPSYAGERIPIINEIVEYTLGEDIEYLNIIDVETTLPMAKQALKGKVSIEDINYILYLLSRYADTMDFFAYFNDVKDVISNQHYADFAKYETLLENSDFEYHTISVDKEGTRQLLPFLEDNEGLLDKIIRTMFDEEIEEYPLKSSISFIANSEYDKAFEVIKRVFNINNTGMYEKGVIHNFALALHMINVSGNEEYVNYRDIRDLSGFFESLKTHIFNHSSIDDIMDRIEYTGESVLTSYLNSLHDNEQSLNFIKAYYGDIDPEEVEITFEDTEFFKRLKAVVTETINDPATYLIEEIKKVQEMSKAFDAFSEMFTNYISVRASDGELQINLKALIDILIKSKALKYLEADFYRPKSGEVDKTRFYYLSLYEKKIKEIVG